MTLHHNYTKHHMKLLNQLMDDDLSYKFLEQLYKLDIIEFKNIKFMISNRVKLVEILVLILAANTPEEIKCDRNSFYKFKENIKSFFNYASYKKLFVYIRENYWDFDSPIDEFIGEYNVLRNYTNRNLTNKQSDNERKFEKNQEVEPINDSSRSLLDCYYFGVWT